MFKVVEKISPEELRKERSEGFEKTLKGLKPDRVPFMPSFHYFPARYVGLTYAEYSSSYQRFSEAVLKVFQDFEFDVLGLAIPGAGMTLPLNLVFLRTYPDLATSIFAIARPFHEILRDKYTRWPGLELPPNAPAQFIGGKFMDADEYDELAKDPITFIAKKIIPRVYEALKNPSSLEAYGALIKFGIELRRFGDVFRNLVYSIRNLGYPTYSSGFGYASLDFIADHLRHITYTS